IGPGDDHHSQLPATRDQFAERIAIAEPFTSMMEGNFRWIKSDAAARAETDRIRMGAFEIIEPELDVELPRIILDQGELCPTHRLLNPRWRLCCKIGGLCDRPANFIQSDKRAGCPSS